MFRSLGRPPSPRPARHLERPGRIVVLLAPRNDARAVGLGREPGLRPTDHVLGCRDIGLFGRSDADRDGPVCGRRRQPRWFGERRRRRGNQPGGEHLGRGRSHGDSRLHERSAELSIQRGDAGGRRERCPGGDDDHAYRPGGARRRWAAGNLRRHGRDRRPRRRHPGRFGRLPIGLDRLGHSAPLGRQWCRSSLLHRARVAAGTVPVTATYANSDGNDLGRPRPPIRSSTRRERTASAASLS